MEQEKIPPVSVTNMNIFFRIKQQLQTSLFHIFTLVLALPVSGQTPEQVVWWGFNMYYTYLWKWGVERKEESQQV